MTIHSIVFKMPKSTPKIIKIAPFIVPFYTNISFLYPLKPLKNQRFSNIFRGYLNETLVEMCYAVLLIKKFKSEL